MAKSKITYSTVSYYFSDDLQSEIKVRVKQTGKKQKTNNSDFLERTLRKIFGMNPLD